jgi:hypothetical protein
VADAYEEVEWYASTFKQYVVALIIIFIPIIFIVQYLVGLLLPLLSGSLVILSLASIAFMIIGVSQALQQNPSAVGLSKYRLMIWFQNKECIILPWHAIKKYKLTRIGSGVIVYSYEARPIELRIMKQGVKRLLEYWVAYNPNVPLEERLHLP